MSRLPVGRRCSSVGGTTFDGAADAAPTRRRSALTRRWRAPATVGGSTRWTGGDQGVRGGRRQAGRLDL